MRIGVLGTGPVGQAIGGRLIEQDHEVRMGSRMAANPTTAAWMDKVGTLASTGTFADAAEFGEILVNATAGIHSLRALEQAGANNLRGKVLIDISNPIADSRHAPVSLTVCNTDSLGEQIQRTFPAVRVVKTLNTMLADVMVEPARVPGEHVTFLCGNDLEAKRQTTELLGELGWPPSWIVDLGDISAARATEMYVPLWMRLHGVYGSGQFNIAITR
jgi:predicted dinucleotide-binding enzyme